jgi:ribosomal protein S12 methylthiotransferase
MRGGHISRPVEELVQEATRLASKGTRELLLIAQDSTYYGLDLYKDRKLPELLRRLSDVEGIGWIRLHYAFPSGFPVEILDVMREKENICSYLDIPLQHISDNMLKSMRRGTTRRKTYELLDIIRDRVPGITLRTTLIAGYPGETEADHQEMLKFVEDARFDRLGIFAYSHEENTHAYSLMDDVPEQVKQERMEAVMAVQQEISFQINQSKVGKKLKVLIDRKEGQYYIGRTESDSPEVDNEVLIEASGNYLRIGDFTSVEITSAGEFDLFGKPA